MTSPPEIGSVCLPGVLKIRCIFLVAESLALTFGGLYNPTIIGKVNLFGLGYSAPKYYLKSPL